MKKYEGPGIELCQQLKEIGTLEEIACETTIGVLHLKMICEGTLKLTPFLAVKLQHAYPTYFRAEILMVKHVEYDVKLAEQSFRESNQALLVDPSYVGVL